MPSDWPSDESYVQTFHHKDGWYFSHREDGTVIITTPAGDTHEIDPHSWASIVASTSAGGETADRYNAARDFHLAVPA